MILLLISSGSKAASVAVDICWTERTPLVLAQVRAHSGVRACRNLLFAECMNECMSG